MEKTYLFYDIETSGLNKCFDQILQFAAIRTDQKLNEIERHNFYVKLNSDTIPTPAAAITHQISLKTLATKGIAEIEAIEIIHKLINTPHTISLGYNTLTFDDEFLRFSFYRNLLSPYTHQFANGCGRMDIYPIVVMYYLFKNEVIKWAQIDGVPTLKLEHLSIVNNFPIRTAHDAINDVENTLALTRCLQKEPEMWNYLCGYFEKKVDRERTDRLSIAFEKNNFAMRMGLLIEGTFGCKNYYQVPVLYLGMHNHYKNQTLWLQLDTPHLSTTTFDSISTTTSIIRKKLGEPGFVLPITPRFTKYMDTNRCKIVNTNIDWLKKNDRIFQDIINHHKEYKYPIVPNLDIDAALYQIGFLSDTELNLCNKFHLAKIDEKLKLLEQMPTNLREQAIRILGRNYADKLPNKIKEEFNRYLQNIYYGDTNHIPVDFKNEKHLTPKCALEKIKILQNSKLNEIQLNSLNELRQYIENLKI